MGQQHQHTQIEPKGNNRIWIEDVLRDIFIAMTNAKNKYKTNYIPNVLIARLKAI